MKPVFAFFFLVILCSNVVLPLTESLQREEVCKLGKPGAGDAEEDHKLSKEKSEGKEYFPSGFAGALKLEYCIENDRCSIPDCRKELVSSLYALQPERPPEA